MVVMNDGIRAEAEHCFTMGKKLDGASVFCFIHSTRIVSWKRTTMDKKQQNKPPKILPGQYGELKGGTLLGKILFETKMKSLKERQRDLDLAISRSLKPR